MKVFKYINKKDGSLIGYHLSSFCQIGTFEEAKRYECLDSQVEKQKQTIQKNFEYLFNKYEQTRNQFEGLSLEEIEVQYETVEDVKIQYKIHTIINETGVHHI